MSDFTIKQNDTRPVLDAQLQMGDGTPINLTGCTVKFCMISTIAKQPKINTQAAIIDAVNGKVRYNWAPSDTDIPGSYKAEFEITFPDGSVQSVPNDDYFTISVMKDIG